MTWYDKLSKSDVFWGGVISGAVACAITALALSVIASKHDELQVFSGRDDIPAVIRYHSHSRPDRVFVQSGLSTNNYIGLGKYLETVSDGYDRTIREAQIRKIAEF